MNTLATHPLYQLLPAIYRERAIYRETAPDPAELEHLMQIVENALEVLELDIGDLYENWFIETCDDWVVPYIGDLLGVNRIGPQADLSTRDAQGGFDGYQESRAYVANALAYRRRKGTAPVLEQLVRDVTGWRARAVEFFDRLAIAQNLNHLRPQNTTVDLRRPEQLRLLGSPFEQNVAYSTELRQGDPGQDRYNVANLGLFVWRLHSYPIVGGTARAVECSDETLRGRCYTFSPLVNRPELPLFNPPQPETEITHLATEVNVPGLLRADPDFEGYQGNHPAFQILINGQSQAIPSSEVLITPLPPFDPAWVATFRSLSQRQACYPRTPLAKKVVAVDPEAGRMFFLDEPPPERVAVNYAYGFSADIGGGPYNRSDAIAQIPAETLPGPADPFLPPLYWEVEQARSGSANPLADAVNQWNGTVKAWQGCLDHSFLPLGRVEIPRRQVRPMKLAEGDRPVWQFGMIRGLEAIAEPGDRQMVITPGRAVDARGDAIELDKNIVIEIDQNRRPVILGQPVGMLSSEVPVCLPAHQPLRLIASCWTTEFQSGYQFNLVPDTEAEQYPEGTYLRLASLSLRTDGTIETITSDAPHRAGNAHPGVVSGLTVVTPPDGLEAIVQPGVAVNQFGTRITLDRNIPLDLRRYQGGQVWLAIADAGIPGIPKWQIYLLTDQEIQDTVRYPWDVFLRLAHLYVPPVSITQHEMPDTLRPKFMAGVVWGLRVKGTVGAPKVTLQPGRAVDADGQVIVVESAYQFGGFGLYRNETVVVAIAYRPSTFPPQWELKLLRDERDPLLLRGQYVKLARLHIDQAGRLKTKPGSFESEFQPGIVSGLYLETYSTSPLLRVGAGAAIDRAGQRIELSESCTVDLSRHPGRALVLFISPQPGQGWRPLAAEDVATSETGQSWQHLGIVPDFPKDLAAALSQRDRQSEAPPTYTGAIVIKDNQTYIGDLEIVIPSSQHLQLKLQILAATGYRPHMQGNLSIRGIVDAAMRRSPNFEPGDCLLNGLLIEGKLTVHPGDLRRITVQHCTLTPEPNWGLTVAATPGVTVPADTDDDDFPPSVEEEESGGFWWLLISLVCLMVQLTKLGFDSRHLPLQKRLEQLTVYMGSEFEKIWCAIREEVYDCQQAERLNGADPMIDDFWNWLCGEPDQIVLRGENADLAIAIDHSVVGSVALAESIPHLTIQDSIVDRGTPHQDGDRAGTVVAIAAPGTQVKMQRSTILGTTQVRSLDASTSLFTDAVLALDRQLGCLRFCYVPPGSQTPVRYRCQPDLALQELPELPAPITAFAFHPVSQTVFLGTAGQGLLQQSSASPPTWEKIDLDASHLTALATTIVGDRSEDKNYFLFAATADNQLYRRQLDQQNQQPIDLKSIPSDITTLVSYYQVLQGRIVTQDTTVTGEGTDFKSELQPGDRITVTMSQANGVVSEETRTVKEIHSKEHLTLEQAFPRNLQESRPFRISFLVAGTVGNGVWRFTAAGDDPTQLAAKLPACEITSLAIDSRHRIFAGTSSGVFRWSVRGQRWRASSQGLTDPQVTALAVDKGDRLFIGTATGMVFRSADHGRHWTSVSSGLPCSKITSLAIQVISDRGQIKDNRITVTKDVARKLRRGSEITIGHQTRIIQDIQKTALILDAEFCSELSGEIKFYCQYLFAGTAGKGIFRSRDSGNSWEPVSPGVMYQQISTMAVGSTALWAGTAIGAVFSSQDYGEHWTVANQGLKNVDNVVPILLRVQPRLTTTEFGQPAYAQLGQTCPQEIDEGAENGAEMGVFHLLRQPQRQRDLQALLDEYLRFGLKERIFYVT